MSAVDREPLQWEITNRHRHLTVAEEFLHQALQAVCSAEQIASAEISLVLTDDAEIQRINREFLGHDYPTDVISFSLNGDEQTSASPRRLQGELIVSLDTAAHVAASQGWSLAAEVVLYVVHGMLHLCGYDDQTEDTRLRMRKREREILSGLSLPSGDDPSRSGWDQAHS